jgi:predicted DNA-binding protein
LIDKRQSVLQLYYMATATSPTSIRLSPAEKRRIAAAARKRGLSPAAYIKRAALAGPAQSDIARLSRLEKLTASVLEAVENELDYHVAVDAWNRHMKSGAKLLKSEEVWRELGV